MRFSKILQSGGHVQIKNPGITNKQLMAAALEEIMRKFVFLKMRIL